MRAKLDLKIYELRKQLRDLYNRGFGLQSPEMLELSEQIDELIVKRMKQSAEDSDPQCLRESERTSVLTQPPGTRSVIYVRVPCVQF